MIDTATDIYLDWIRTGLKNPAKTQVGLAAHLGIAHPQITQLLKGKRKLKVHEIPRIAEYLETQPPQSTEIVPARTGTVAAAVAGTVEAGAFREVDEFDQSERELVIVPADERYPAARVMIFDVAGDSMNAMQPRPILPGDRLLCLAYEDLERFVDLRSGLVVVVERTRDGGHTREWSVKQIEMFADRTEFHPRSTNAKHKPIVVPYNIEADDGVTVQVIALVRRTVNEMPSF